MTDVLKFPSKEPPALLIGPFEEWRVVVKGRRIPRLSGRMAPDGGTTFIVDDRFSGGPFYGETAYQAAYLLAQALAVGSGYADFEASEAGRPFAPIAKQLDAPSSIPE